MCGRFKLSASGAKIVQAFRIASHIDLLPRYNIAPGQDIATIRWQPETKERGLVMLRWGLVPAWAKEAKIGYSLINARAETLTEKPSFREAFRKRRCLIPADGFYEWRQVNAKRKQPYAITMKDSCIFAFAGLWEQWQDKVTGEIIESCTVITTAPNEICAPIHDRMPVILAPQNYAAWLGEESATQDQLTSILKPYPADRMTTYPIAPQIGTAKNDSPLLAEPMADQEPPDMNQQRAFIF